MEQNNKNQNPAYYVGMQQQANTTDTPINTNVTNQPSSLSKGAIIGSFGQDSVGQIAEPNIWSEQQKGNWRNKHLLIAGGGALAVLLVVVVSILLVHAKFTKNNQHNTTSQSAAVSGAVKDDPLKGNVLPFNLYVPLNMNWQTKPLLYVWETKPDNSLLSYSVGGQFGQGLTKGTYDFYVYTPKNHYNPPSDCGMPGNEIGTTTAAKCQLYDSSDSIKAYYTNRQARPGIQNTSVKSYMSMFAAIDDMTVVCVSSADTSASELYSIIKSMKKIQASDLPKTSINFDGSKVRAQLQESSKDLFAFAETKNNEYKKYIPSYLENRSENTKMCSVTYTKSCLVNYSYFLDMLSKNKPSETLMKENMLLIYSKINSEGGWMTTDTIDKPIGDARALILSKENAPVLTMTKNFDNKYNVRIILAVDGITFDYEK